MTSLSGMAGAESAIDGVSASTDAAAAAAESTDGAYIDWLMSLGEVPAAATGIDEVTAATQGADAAASAAAESAGAMASQTGTAGEAANHAGASFGAFSSVLTESQAAATSLTGEVGRLTTEVGQKAVSAFKSASEALGEDAGAMAVAEAGAVGLAVAITTVAGTAAAMAADFQDATITLQNWGDLSAAQAEKVSGSMLQMAMDSEFSAGNMTKSLAGVAGRLETLTGQTVDTASATKLMSNASNLAEATEHDLGATTADLTNIMLAYNLSLDQAGEASDRLFNVSRITGIGIDELTSAATRLHARLGVAAPSLQDMGTLMVDLQAHGITGTRGLMAMSAGIQTLLSGSKEVDDVLGILGVRIFDGNGKFIGLRETIARLGPALAGLNEQSRTQAERMLFGASAGAQLDGVLRDGVGTFDEFAARVAKTGTAMAAAEADQEKWSVKIEVLKNRVNALMIQLGDQLLPVIIDVGSAIAGGAVAAVEYLIEAVQSVLPPGEEMAAVWRGQIYPALQGVASVVSQTLLPPLKVLGGFLSDHKEIVGAFAVALLAVAAALGVYAAATVVASAATAAFGVVLAIAFSPITLIVLAIGGLILVIYELVTHWDEVKAAMGAVADFIVGEFFAALDALKEHWDYLLLLIPGIGPILFALVHWFSEIKQGVLDAWNGMIDGIVSTGQAIGDFYMKHWVDIWRTILTGGVYLIVKLIVDHWSELTSATRTAFEAVRNAMETALSAMLTAVKTGGMAVVQWFIDLPGHILSALAGAGKWLLGVGRDIIVGLVSGIIAADVAIFNFFRDLPGRILSFLAGAGRWLYDIGKQIVQGLINGIRDAGPAVLDAIKGLGGGAVGKFAEIVGIGSPSRVFYGFGVNIGEGLAGGIDASTPQAVAAVERMGAAMTATMQRSLVNLQAMQLAAIGGMGSLVGNGYAGDLSDSWMHVTPGSAGPAPGAYAPPAYTPPVSMDFSGATGGGGGGGGGLHAAISQAQTDLQALAEAFRVWHEQTGGDAEAFRVYLEAQQAVADRSKANADQAHQDAVQLTELSIVLGKAGISGEAFVAQQAMKLASQAIGDMSADTQKAMADVLVAAHNFSAEFVAIVANSFKLAARVAAATGGAAYAMNVGGGIGIDLPDGTRISIGGALTPEGREKVIKRIIKEHPTVDPAVIRAIIEGGSTPVPEAHTGALVTRGGLVNVAPAEIIATPQQIGSGQPASYVTIDLRGAQFVDDASIDRLMDRLSERFAQMLPGAGIQVRR